MSKKQQRRQRNQRWQKSPLDKRAEQKNPEIEKQVNELTQASLKNMQKSMVSFVYGIDTGTTEPPAVEVDNKIPGLPKDDQPIKLKKKDEPVRSSSIFGDYGSWLYPSMYGTPKPSSWVPDSFSPKDMLDEIQKRPQGRFSEIEDFTHRSSQHCRCEKCGFERRALARELRNLACENR